MSKISEQVVEELHEEMRNLRRQLGGAEIAIGLLGKALANISPQDADRIEKILTGLDMEHREQPCVQSLFLALRPGRHRRQTPVQSRPELRLVDDPDSAE